MRRQHMWRVRDFKIIAGDHVATHHKPLVCVVHIQKRREDNIVGDISLNGGNAVGTQWGQSGDTVGTQWGHSRCIQMKDDSSERERERNREREREREGEGERGREGEGERGREIYGEGMEREGEREREKEREKLKQHNVYLGGAACRKGGTETEIRRRIQFGASAWRKVEEVVGYISRKLKEKGLSSCVTPAYLYDLLCTTGLPIRPLVYHQPTYTTSCVPPAYLYDLLCNTGLPIRPLVYHQPTYTTSCVSPAYLYDLLCITSLPIRPLVYHQPTYTTYCVSPAYLYHLLCITSLPIRRRDHSDDRKPTRETACLREYFGEKNCRSEKYRQRKNGGVEGGSW